MKRIALIIVAVFEILCGLSGLAMVLGGISGVIYPYEVAPILWFGVFPVLSLSAGIMLLLHSKYAYQLSYLVLLLQIPFIYISGHSLLRVGIAFNLYISATWNSRAGVNATMLGINFLALGVLFVLLWSRKGEKNNVEPNNITQIG